ncbi:MAG: SpoIIE family protein phosphatase [Bacteroidales bacterium]|nr:SpoIIE family protein phosphatase [Bacteroidales bacterium]
MSIRFKLGLFFAGILLVFVLLVGSSNYFNNRRQKEYTKIQTQNIKNAAETAISLNNDYYSTLSIDYTFWDDMYNFNIEPDEQWAADYLFTATDSYGVDYIWIYNLNCNLQYYTNKEEVDSFAQPISNENLYQLLDTTKGGEKRFFTSYEKSKGKVYIIYGATIHKTDDIDRVNKPSGFFITAKIIDSTYLEKVSLITNCKVSLSLDTSTCNGHKKVFAIQSCYKLFNGKDEQIASILFDYNDHFIKQDLKFQRWSLWAFILIVFISFVFLILYLNLVLSAPLRRIIKSLNQRRPEFIEKFTKKSNEFGQISKLIILFFEQRKQLEVEIEERKTIHEQLVETIEELNTRNEEIIAQSEELSSANQSLAQLSVVASKIDNSVIISNENFDIIYVNNGFLNIYEIESNLLVYIKTKNVLDYNKVDEFVEFIEKCVSEKHSATSTFKFLTQKGNIRWKQTTVTPTFDKNNKLENIIFIETDVTDVKNAEEQISIWNKSVTESINYAAKIQASLFPSSDIFKSYFNSYFIFNRPRDIISGDFIWVKMNGKKIFLAVADCTGHGIPGAFMSVLSGALLNEILHLEKLHSASQILETLRENVITVLNQRSDNNVRDGLDISFCIIEKKKSVVQFAGASHSLFLVRNNDLLEFKGTRTSISFSEKMFPIENHEIKYKEDDTFYLFTDGYVDQFDNNQEQKYLKYNFKKLLLKNVHLEIETQGKLIETEFENWKGNNRQIDDVLVFGFKI